LYFDWGDQYVIGTKLEIRPIQEINMASRKTGAEKVVKEHLRGILITKENEDC
jgi:hypothetical protein